MQKSSGKKYRWRFPGKLEEVTGFQLLTHNIVSLLKSVEENLRTCFTALIIKNSKQLSEAKNKSEEIGQEINKINADIFQLANDSEEKSAESVSRYAQMVAALQIIFYNLTLITDPAYDHVANKHHTLVEEQENELKELDLLLSHLIDGASKALSKNKFSKLTDLERGLDKLKTASRQFNKSQMKRIKSKKTGSRLSMIFINILMASERIGEQIINLIKLVMQTKGSAKK